MENRSGIGLSWAPKVSPISSVQKKSSDKVFDMQRDSFSRHENQLVDGLFVPPRDSRKLNKLLEKNVKDTSGPSWFDVPAPTITPELKKDLQILKARNSIHPKRHFKKAQKSKELPKYFQMGTVIEPASEFFSSRLNKKERKATLADELLSDQCLKIYRKRKVQEIEDKNRPGGIRKWKNKAREMQKHRKQRTG